MDARAWQCGIGQPLPEPMLCGFRTRGECLRTAVASRLPGEPLQVIAGDLRIGVLGPTVGVDEAGNRAPLRPRPKLRRPLEQPVGQAAVDRLERGARRYRDARSTAAALPPDGVESPACDAPAAFTRRRSRAPPPPWRRMPATAAARRRSPRGSPQCAARSRRRRTGRLRRTATRVGAEPPARSVPRRQARRDRRRSGGRTRWRRLPAARYRPGHEHRRAEVRRLLLHTARIADDQRRVGSRPDEAVGARPKAALLDELSDYISN